MPTLMREFQRIASLPGATLPDQEVFRLLAAYQRVADLYRSIEAYVPPEDAAWDWGGWQHEWYPALVRQHAEGLRELLTQLGRKSAGDPTTALANYARLQLDAAQIHGAVNARIVRGLTPDAPTRTS